MSVNDKMDDVENYWFKPTKRIDGFIYIKDGDGNKVSVNGKPKRFKTTTMCARFIYQLEYMRNLSLEKENEAL